MLGSVFLSPDATRQFEHRPLQEQLQVRTKCDSYRCIFQRLLQLKQMLYLQAINVTMISTFNYKEGKNTNIILHESNILAILSFKTSMMVLLVNKNNVVHNFPLYVYFHSLHVSGATCPPSGGLTVSM
jgi:hypothetical protein